MIRLVMRQDDMCHAANAGGPVVTEYKTFDVIAPEVEAWLTGEGNSYTQRQFVGIELLPSAGEGK